MKSKIMDPEIRFELYETLAKKGNPVAQFNFASMMYAMRDDDEEHRYVKKFWYEQSAIQGYVPAQTQVGCNYLFTMPINRDKAFEWFQKSADQDDARGQFFLSYCYLCAIGVEKNVIASIKWLHKSFCNGYDTSRSHLEWDIEKSLKIKHVFEFIEENSKLSDTIAKQNKEIEWLKATIAELNITVPIEGGIEYQKAKKRFDEYKK